jgi:hypothetical protein
MSEPDDRALQLLAEIRDGQREQTARQLRLVELYEQALAGQAQALAAQRELMRRMRPMLLAALGLILVILGALLALVVRLWQRYS